MQYVILGAGPSGVIAAETLRKTDPSSAITMISSEPEPPYSRMAIPYYLTGKIAEQGTYLRKTEGHFDSLRVDYRHGRAKRLEADDKRLYLADDSVISYDRLLVATGARPVRPPIPGLQLPNIHHCWTLEDARAIEKLAAPGSHVVLMGAGFVGCIVLEALAKRGVNLTVVEMGSRMVPRMMNDVAGGMLTRWCEKLGVRVLTSTGITSVSSIAAEKAKGVFGRLKHMFSVNPDDQLDIALSNGEMLSAHLLVVCAGVKSNTDFLDGSGVKVDRGILVDRYLRTSVNDIYAAGDVAQGFDFSTKGHDVHAIQPTASEHGRIAAMNMAGHNIAYNGSLQMNVLDTMGLISCSFGLWGGTEWSQKTESIDHENFRYLCLQFEDDVLIGGQAVGLTQHVGVLRGLIQSETKLGPWKEKLMADPHRLMEAYLARTI